MTKSIRAKSFRAWFNANLRPLSREITHQGADAGFPGITYTRDLVKLHDKFGDEIWQMAVEDAEEYGASNVCSFISGFSRSDMMHSIDTFKSLMVWYACEKLARENSNYFFAKFD